MDLNNINTTIAINGLLGVLLLAATYTDVRYRWIPNWQTVPAFGLGIALNGIGSGPSGLLSSLGGGLLGLAILVVPYTLGYVGGGDVKLQIAVGALVGWPIIFWAAWYGALASGMLAILVVIKSGAALQFSRYVLCLLANAISQSAGIYLPARLRSRLLSLKAEKPPVMTVKLPYGLAIAVGLLAALYVQQGRV